MIAGKIIRFLPGALRVRIRRRYYRRVVKKYTKEAWEWSPVVLPRIPVGGVVFDLGANVGYLSKLFAEQVGPGGSVFSVEPIPDTHDALSSSMRFFFPDTVTVYQCCVSDREGMVQMVVPTYEGGGDNFYESHITSSSDDAEQGQVFQVEAVALDTLVKRAGKIPDFVKIDVEGHELAVIRSGRELLTQNKPPLLIEVAGNPDEAGTPACQLMKELDELGYAPYTLSGSDCRPRQEGDKEVDYLFLPRGD